MFPFLKIFKNTQTGLVLGSGGAKGLAHISVIEYLENMGISFDMIVGSSIGAVVGALYCCGSLNDFKESITKKSNSELLKYFDPVFPTSGLIEGKALMKYLGRFIHGDRMIEDFEKPLAIVATEYYTGRSIIFRTGNVLEALRASISIPGFLTPVKFKNTFLLDGGAANPLPINIARGMGAGLTVAVNLHPSIVKRKWEKFVKSKVEKSYNPVDSRSIEIINNSAERALAKKDISAERKNSFVINAIESWIKNEKKEQEIEVPNIFEIIMQSIDIMEFTNTQMMLKYNTPTVLIEPEVGEIGTLDFNNADKIITEGYLACSRVRKELERKIKI